MSERIVKYWHHLKVLQETQSSKLFDCIVWYSDREIVLCIKEIFLNLGNLVLDIGDKDQRFLETNVSGVEELTRLGELSVEEDRRLISSHITLVQKGLAIALTSLKKTQSIEYDEEDKDLLSDSRSE